MILSSLTEDKQMFSRTAAKYTNAPKLLGSRKLFTNLSFNVRNSIWVIADICKTNVYPIRGLGISPVP